VPGAQGSNLATSAAGVAQFIYNTTTGVLFYDADGSGGTTAIRIATFTGAPSVAAGDFLLI
jgi:Ca2+-binding RTX toxin-like protein